MDNSKTYVHILMNTLTKKLQILNELLTVSEMQKSYLSGEIDSVNNIEIFDETIEKKAKFIEQLDQLDDGFETVYERVKEEITEKKEMYKMDILQLQGLIREITDKSVKLQALESQNKLKFDIAFINRKQEIRDYKKNIQSATKYYQNMSSQYENESYFLDKKK